MAVDKESETSLVDVPEDALSASSLSQFHTRMRPYLWMQYPAGTTAEINVIINQKWKAIQATRKDSKNTNMHHMVQYLHAVFQGLSWCVFICTQ